MMSIARTMFIRRQWNTLAVSNKLSTTVNHSNNNDPTASGKCNTPKVYELRIYSIGANHMQKFLKLSAEKFHLRTAHSKLLGYWTSEIGGLNQVVHIWEYDSLSHRASVRGNLAQDADWNAKYLSQVIGMFQGMTNSLMTLIPGSGIYTPTAKGVYELQTLTLRDSPKVWSQALISYVQACQGIENEGTKLVGAWQSVLGPRQSATLLWQHPGPDSCISLQAVANDLHESTALSPYIAEGHNRLLLPHAVSPMQ